MNKQDRDFYLSLGICPRCMKRPLEPNRKMCYECLGYERDRYARRKSSGELDDKSEKHNKKKMEEYYDRKGKGICTRCGKSPKQHGLLCNKCYAKCRQRKIKNKKDIDRSERPSYGLCYICGEPLMESKKVCEKCYKTRLSTVPAMLNNPNRECFVQSQKMFFCK